MLVERIGARLMSSRHPIVDVTPVFRRNGVRLDADRFDGIDVAQHVFDLGHPSILSRISPPGRTKGRRLVGLSADLRTMSMREMIVPKSLALSAQ